MWTLVMYDLPTETKKQRKFANLFRKELLKAGFEMFQYSVYSRHSASIEGANTHKKRVKALLPKDGKVLILQLTDRQFTQIDVFESSDQRDSPGIPDQLLVF